MSFIVNKSRFIDPRLHKSLSRIYVKGDDTFGERKCRICGQWFTWLNYEVDNCMGESVVRREKGQNSMCEDWIYTGNKARQERYRQQVEKMRQMRAERSFGQFADLLRKKII